MAVCHKREVMNWFWHKPFKGYSMRGWSHLYRTYGQRRCVLVRIRERRGLAGAPERSTSPLLVSRLLCCKHTVSQSELSSGWVRPEAGQTTEKPPWWVQECLPQQLRTLSEQWRSVFALIELFCFTSATREEFYLSDERGHFYSPGFLLYLRFCLSGSVVRPCKCDECDVTATE